MTTSPDNPTLLSQCQRAIEGSLSVRQESSRRREKSLMVREQSTITCERVFSAWTMIGQPSIQESHPTSKST